MARLQALRGATTLEADTLEQLNLRVGELLGEMLRQNAIAADDLVSVFFTATPDITSGFPATAARAYGLSEVALFGAQEMAVDGALGLCVRILLHCYTAQSRDQLRHVYLHQAASLRPDLSQSSDG